MSYKYLRHDEDGADGIMLEGLAVPVWINLDNIEATDIYLARVLHALK